MGQQTISENSETGRSSDPAGLRDPRAVTDQNGDAGPAAIDIRTRETLAEALCVEGHISRAEAARLRLAMASNGETVGTLVTRLGLLSADNARDAIAGVMALDPFPDRKVDWDTGIAVGSENGAPVLDPDYCRTVGIIPLAIETDHLIVAMLDPSDFAVREAVGLFFGLMVQPVAVNEATFEHLHDQVFAKDAVLEGGADLGDSAAYTGALSDEDVARLEDLASDAPVIHCLESIIGNALNDEASDVHLVVVRAGMAVRFRVDGSLGEKDVLSASLGNGVVLRLKVLAGLDIAERRIPQDGRIRLQVAGTSADIRLSTMPQSEGEGAVLRFLKHIPERLHLPALGFPQHTLSRLLPLINAPEGLILVSGPTGSGKTTTLYAALRAIRRKDVNIATIENPVEQRIDGIAQVEINPAIGFDFPKALHAMLRQDPDVILLGEIRGEETAETAVRAALTGHLVLSTIHTDRAVATVPRLLDMGVEDFLLASTLKAVLGQRLVRRICPDCRSSKPFTASEAAAASAWSGVELEGSSGSRGEDCRHSSGSGCQACAHSGYSGRISISELLVVDAAIQAAIRERCDAGYLDEIARKAGFRSMAEEALALCLDGTISLEDAMRIVPSIRTEQSVAPVLRGESMPGRQAGRP